MTQPTKPVREPKFKGNRLHFHFYAEPENYEHLRLLTKTYRPGLFDRAQTNSMSGCLNAIMKALRANGLTDFEELCRHIRNGSSGNK